MKLGWIGWSDKLVDPKRPQEFDFFSMALLFTIIFMSKSLAIDHSNSSHLHSRALKQYLCNLLCKQSPRLSNHLCRQHWHLGLYWGLVRQFHTKRSDIERRPQNLKKYPLVLKTIMCVSCHLDTAPDFLIGAKCRNVYLLFCLPLYIKEHKSKNYSIFNTNFNIWRLVQMTWFTH